jgi:hypothetical protein
MKTGRELFEIWAPHGAVWSPWVAPALFAQMACPDQFINADDDKTRAMVWHEQVAAHDTAIILDLPGAQSVKWGLALARVGYRPVPLINASPGPTRWSPTLARRSDVFLDMDSVISEICAGALWLRELTLGLNAPPVFILDALRTTGTQPLRDDLFDNRWMVFPQDFPSARFLAKQKIKRVVLVQTRSTQPMEDLRHVLLRWQEAGIEILVKGSANTGMPSQIMVAKPSRFRAFWYRALAMIGLRRSSVGGFGGFVPESFGGG